MRLLLPACLLILLAACAAKQPIAASPEPVLTPGVVPLTLEQDRELSR